MRMTSRWTVLVSALAAGVMLVTGGPAGTAGAASAGSSARAAARTAEVGGLGNYRIGGDEDAIGCLTAHRCVAVGYGGGHAPAQVVTVVGGRQAEVSVVRSVSNLVAVSCPNRFGCWAMGPPREGERSWVLVKIGPAGSITKVTSVKLPAGVALSSISCTSRTTCEVFGIVTLASGWNEWYLAAWNGSKLSHRYVVGDVYASIEDVLGGISCWQTTCVAVGTWWCGGSTCVGRDAILTTTSGSLETSAMLSARGGFTGVSCVSSSTCYATAFNGTFVTLDDGRVGTTESEPGFSLGSSIECAGTTCWTAWLDGNPNSNSPVAFVMITNGAPTGTPVTDPALTAAYWPSIARRGSGFAAVGEAAVNGGPRVSEVVTN
jgi:hypothetical protein